ncbi:hypothetical protein DGN07_22740 [Xanthomonas citri pv. fuscans]|nr:hypothetical protein DGN07_22740 [Xanthomonas citri pv. fuscans]
MDYRDPETARRRSIFHQRIQIGFPGRSFVVDLQSYFSSLLARLSGIQGCYKSNGVRFIYKGQPDRVPNSAHNDA